MFSTVLRQFFFFFGWGFIFGSRYNCQNKYVILFVCCSPFFRLRKILIGDGDRRKYISFLSTPHYQGVTQPLTNLVTLGYSRYFERVKNF
jgi:hypothetical protein